MIMEFVFQMDILEDLRDTEVTTTVEMVILDVNTQKCQKSKYNYCHEIGFRVGLFLINF
jgi:hypothetical protein